MRLEELFDRAKVTADNLCDIASGEISGITMDSRLATKGSLFVCMPNMTRESESFLPQAAEQGAVAALVHSPSGFATAKELGLSAALIEPDGLSFNEALWRICDEFFDHPTRNMRVVGVTGTNGKTTVAWILRDMLQAQGLRAAYLGTLGFWLPDSHRELNNTTPFTVELYNLLAEARDAGVEALAMEVSSHALAQLRADGVEFDAAIFTNLTQDHLDFHGSMSAYSEAKFRLFDEIPRQSRKRFVAAINADDSVGEEWIQRLEKANTKVVGYGSLGPDLASDFVSIGLESIRLRLRYEFGNWTSVVSAPLGGSYNAMNLVSAAAGMIALGFSIGDVASSLPSTTPVPGRFEPVPNPEGIAVIVDYAHTPDALEKLLDAIRPLSPGKVITVFGCGGDRDRAKRPLMARAASQRSDLTVITSDNPRTEDPKQILREVETGIERGRSFVSIEDRTDAVAYAIKAAEARDVVVIAGKGHETYQIIGREKIHMDDRELVQEALKCR